jgi:phosphoglycolate phosphatase
MATKAVLFDLDGTLVDSARDLAETLNEVLAEEGLPALTVEAVKGMIGDGGSKLLERGLAAARGDPGRAPALLRRFVDLYEPRATHHTRTYPGAEGILAHLTESSFRLSLVTNKPQSAALKILDALDLARFFGAVVGGDTLPVRKPHPAPLLHAAAQLGAAPDETVMVGDNHHDVEAARRAGMPVIVVGWVTRRFRPRSLELTELSIISLNWRVHWPRCASDESSGVGSSVKPDVGVHFCD